jgi:hexokinase
MKLVSTQENRYNFQSIVMGKIFEKMISGMYLGEIVRLVLLDLLSKGRIFVGTSSLKQKFDTSYISRVLRYESNWKYFLTLVSDTSEDLSDVSKLLAEVFDINTSSLDDRKLLTGICRFIYYWIGL